MKIRLVLATLVLAACGNASKGAADADVAPFLLWEQAQAEWSSGASRAFQSSGANKVKSRQQ